jgi:hypothetical protein
MLDDQPASFHGAAWRDAAAGKVKMERSNDVDPRFRLEQIELGTHTWVEIQ